MKKFLVCLLLISSSLSAATTIYEGDASLNAAQINALNVTPVAITLPVSPGAGEIIFPIGVIYKYQNALSFSGNGQITIRYSSNGRELGNRETFWTSNYSAFVGNQIYSYGNSFYTYTSFAIEASGVEVFLPVGVITGGSGTLTVRFLYMIQSL